MPTETFTSRAKSRAKAALGTAGRSFNGPAPALDVMTELRRRAVVESADMIEPHLAQAALLSSHSAIQAHAAERLVAASDGLFLEFGFYLGNSAAVFSEALQRRRPASTLYSFDAFMGLRDSWSQLDHGRGAFDLAGKAPEAPTGTTLVIGWLEDTLPTFLAGHEGPVTFCHFDLDVYEPTAFGLDAIRPRLVPGSLILFDELHSYPGWQSFEYRALNECFAPDEFRYIAFGPEQALIEWVGTN